MVSLFLLSVVVVIAPISSLKANAFVSPFAKRVQSIAGTETLSQSRQTNNEAAFCQRHHIVPSLLPSSQQEGGGYVFDRSRANRSFRVRSQSSSSDVNESSTTNPTITTFMEQLTEETKTLLNDIWNQATATVAEAEGNGGATTTTIELTKIVESQIQQFSPALIVQLRQLASNTTPDDVHHSNDDTMEIISKARAIGLALSTYLENSLQRGKDLLKSFLDAGEIRKLDTLIGKAAREGTLDSSFFTVLNMNLKDAVELEQQEGDSNTTGGSNDDNKEAEEGTGGASRMSILQHIYTRCQEEIEKQVPPGVGLLNKLMRTEQPSIRKNQLEHYLGLPTDEKTITTPDGKTIPLKGSKKALVSTTEFVEAIQNTVKQVRMLERSSVVSKESAADVVESARSIAKEARIVIGNTYGPDSETLRTFEDGLMPVFRPSPTSKEYMPSTTSQQ